MSHKPYDGNEAHPAACGPWFKTKRTRLAVYADRDPLLVVGQGFDLNLGRFLPAVMDDVDGSILLAHGAGKLVRIVDEDDEETVE